MGEGYNTGDDVIFEVLGAIVLATILTTNQNYLDMIPLPTHWAVTLTLAILIAIPILSQGRIFWAAIGGLAWVLLKTDLVKPDETELIIEYDEAGWPINIEEKEKEKPEGSA